MQRYWDKTEQERAAMTREQVQAYLDVELMEQGVAKVAQPELQPVEETKLAKRRFFQIFRKGEYSQTAVGVLFNKVEDAEAFLSMAPWFAESKYVPSPSPNINYAMPGRELSIQPVDLPLESDIANHTSTIERNAAIKAANEKLLAEYHEAVKKVNDAVSGVWDDWQKCRDKERQAAKIYATLDEYIRLCDGNRETALRFLGKLFSADEIAEAVAWRGDDAIQPEAAAEVA
jgi:hypothetical protein